MLSEKKILNETKNHNPLFKLNGRSLNKHQRIPKGQSKIDNPEKLATLDTKQKQKHNTIFVGDHYAQSNTDNVYKTWSLLYLFFYSVLACYNIGHLYHFPPVCVIVNFRVTSNQSYVWSWIFWHETKTWELDTFK